MEGELIVYKQIIIARKDLNMSSGKLSAQVSHASMAFLTCEIRKNALVTTPKMDYWSLLKFDRNIYEQWIDGSFTKCVLEAKDKNKLLKAVELAEGLGMKENEDFFLIKDNCYTELEPEEFDEDGQGRTLTCIGFKPMDAEIIDKIGKKFQLYK